MKLIKIICLISILTLLAHIAEGQTMPKLDAIFKNLQTTNPGIVKKDGKYLFIIPDFPAAAKVNVEIQKAPEGGAVKGEIANKNLIFDLSKDMHKFSEITYTVVDLKNSKNKFEIKKKPKDDFSEILKLPDSKLALSFSITDNSGPCEVPGKKQNSVTYDFAKNSLENDFYKKNLWKFWKDEQTDAHTLRVGKPMVFRVININPFRDSVIISHSTMNYVDSSLISSLGLLFDIKSTIQKLTPLIPDSSQINECKIILSDVYALGAQIKTMKKSLAELKEGEDLCEIINSIKLRTEEHFKSYGYNNPQETLETFLPNKLSCLNSSIENDSVRKVIQDSVSNILMEYYAFRNAKNYFLYKVPQLQNTDEYIFHLSVLPKHKKTSYSIVDNQPIKVPLIGGFKVDASAGLFFTKLQDHRFTLKADSTIIPNVAGGDSVINRRNQILKQDIGDRDFGVSAMLHFYPRISTWFNVGASLGAGLSVGPNPSLRYLGGGSILLGRNGRLTITKGISAGFVDRLAEGYTNEGYTSLNNKEDLTKRVFHTHRFWSIGYNIPIFKNRVNIAKQKVKEAEEKKETEDKEKD